MKKVEFPSRKAFGEEELKAIIELFEYYKNINSDFGYQGYYEKLYTDKFIDYMGEKGYADAVCSGTAALFVAVQSLRLEKGSHVIVSPITDPGTLNAIILNNLIPVVADSKCNSYNMGAKQFEERITKDTKAVIVVHAAGEAAEIDEIVEIAKKNNIYVIEDCSQAHGALYKGRKVGTFGDIGVFSTMFSKAHSTGSCGGILFTKNYELYKLIRACADRGKSFFDENFDPRNAAQCMFPALNFNIDEISCAIGIKSLEKLDFTISKRLEFLYNLNNCLKNNSKVCKLLNLSKNESPFYKQIEVDITKIKCSKVEFANFIKEQGVTVNPHYMYIVCEWPWVKKYLYDDFITKNAINCRDSSFNLLFNERFGQDEVTKIIGCINKAEEKFLI